MFNKQNLFTKHQENLAERKTPLSGSTSNPNSGGNVQSSSSSTPLSSGVGSTTSSGVVHSQAREAAATPKTAETKAPQGDQDSGSRLIVGPDVKLKGAEILDCDTLVVEGRVEATMDSRVIKIAEEGSFAGKVGIDIAEIYGRFDGELTARQQLIIHATGRVSGTIRYGKILIEEGGELSGDVKSLANGDIEASASRVKPLVVSSSN